MRAAVLEWAKASLVPLSTVKPDTPWDELAPLGRMIGDARVVALSEGVHSGAEPLEFRNRLLQYLVQQKGFTAIAIESGLIESYAVYRYVRGAPADLNAVVTTGFSWGFDELPQNRDLIRWLRDYNADPKCPRKVNFYGFDVSGNPTSSRQTWTQRTILRHVFEFLSKVDPTVGQVFRNRLAPYIESTQFHMRHVLDSPNYSQLKQEQRDALTGAIADLITWLERHEAKYTAASSAVEYAWACRAAVAARQTDNQMRQYPVGFMQTDADAVADDQMPPFFAAHSDVRDRAQADNLDWIVRQEGPNAKVLLYASRFHVSAASLKVSWQPHRQEQHQEVAGTYLRRLFGAQFVTIGNLIGSGTVTFGPGRVMTLDETAEESLDGFARRIGVPLFLLDLRTAPPEVTSILEEECQLDAGPQRMKLPVRQAFDILLYIDVVTPAITTVAED